MNDERLNIRLGEVFALCNETLGEHGTEPAVLSLSKYDGVVLANDYFDKRIASRTLDKYKVLAPGEWAYSTIHIDEGSIARNNLGVSGVLSPMYTTMRWVGRDHDEFFFEVLLRSPPLLAMYRDRAQGTVNRRRSLPFKAFASLVVSVPSLPKQRRIIDLLTSVDGAIAAAVAARDQMAVVIEGLLSEWVRSWQGGRVPLRDLVISLGSGPSWNSSQESTEPGPHSVRVLGITNTPPGKKMDLRPATYVSGLGPTVRLLKSSSLLMIRTNGNRSRIGNVYEVPAGVVGSAFSAFQIGLDFRTVADAQFAFWMFSVPSVQSLISENASGTTGLGNIAVGWLRNLELPWPDLSARNQLIALWTSASNAEACYGEEVEGLVALRSALVSDLLSGTHDIPEAYDELVSS